MAYELDILGNSKPLAQVGFAQQDKDVEALKVENDQVWQQARHKSSSERFLLLF